MKKIYSLRPSSYMLLLSILLFAIGNKCLAEEPDTMVRMRIKPTLVDIKPGDIQQFYVIKEPTRLTSAYATNKVVWYVNGIEGGGETIGTISNNGLYTAPQQTPQLSEIHVSAKVITSSNLTVWATVIINGKLPQYQTVKEWGESLDGLKHFSKPEAIAIEYNGDILIADGKIKRFSGDGEFKMQMGESKGDYEGSLVSPLNLAVDDKGLIFVSDGRTGPPRIQVFSPEGKYLYGFATKGSSKERVMDTRGMAFDSNQKLFIGDLDNMRVSVFEHSGKFVQTIGKKGVFPGEFNVPFGVALDANDDLFVASYFGPCQKMTNDGHYLFSFAYPDPPNGHIFITDAVTDKWGDVYLIVKGNSAPDGKSKSVKDSDGNNINIKKYNNNGDFIANISLSDSSREALRLTVDDSGKLYVLFKGEKKIGVEILTQLIENKN